MFSDRGIPDGHRHMNGYGSHTFKLVNAKGEAVYCKFHYKVHVAFGTRGKRVPPPPISLLLLGIGQRSKRSRPLQPFPYFHPQGREALIYLISTMSILYHLVTLPNYKNCVWYPFGLFFSCGQRVRLRSCCP